MRMKRNLKAIPVLVAGLFTSQLSIAAGSVSADPHAGHDMSAMQMPCQHKALLSSQHNSHASCTLSLHFAQHRTAILCW